MIQAAVGTVCRTMWPTSWKANCARTQLRIPLSAGFGGEPISTLDRTDDTVCGVAPGFVASINNTQEANPNGDVGSQLPQPMPGHHTAPSGLLLQQGLRYYGAG